MDERAASMRVWTPLNTRRHLRTRVTKHSGVHCRRDEPLLRRNIERTLDIVRTPRYERTLAPSSSRENPCANSLRTSATGAPVRSSSERIARSCLTASLPRSKSELIRTSPRIAGHIAVEACGWSVRRLTHSACLKRRIHGSALEIATGVVCRLSAMRFRSAKKEARQRDHCASGPAEAERVGTQGANDTPPA